MVPALASVALGAAPSLAGESGEGSGVRRGGGREDRSAQCAVPVTPARCASALRGPHTAGASHHTDQPVSAREPLPLQVAAVVRYGLHGHSGLELTLAQIAPRTITHTTFPGSEHGGGAATGRGR